MTKQEALTSAQEADTIAFGEMFGGVAVVSTLDGSKFGVLWTPPVAPGEIVPNGISAGGYNQDAMVVEYFRHTDAA